jgi:hypothetical protein
LVATGAAAVGAGVRDAAEDGFDAKVGAGELNDGPDPVDVEFTSQLSAPRIVSVVMLTKSTSNSRFRSTYLTPRIHATLFATR